MAKFIYEYQDQTIKKNSLINPNSEFILDCPNSKVFVILSKFLNIIDDLQQICGEDYAQELTDIFDRLEVFYRHTRHADIVNLQCRNEIRIICKEAIKLAGIFNYNFN